MTLRPKDDVDELIGVLILRRRQVKKTKEQIARAMGIGRDTLSLLENGEFDPTARMLRDYAEAVGMALNWTLDRQAGAR